MRAVFGLGMRWILLALWVTSGASRMQILAAAEPTGAASAPARKQILIEAVVIEVALSDAKGSGLDELKLPAEAVSRYPSARGAIDTPGMLLLARPRSSVPTNAVDSQPGGFHYLARLGDDLDATLKALAGDRRVKVHQRPRIQTSQEEPARLFVGESRPYSQKGAGSGLSATQQVLIGLMFEVTPSIQPDGLVAMDMHLKIDRFEGNHRIENVGEVPIVSSREAEAKIAVQDHGTILLGGMVGADQDAHPAYVPFPKELPVPRVLSARSSTLSGQKELMILVRPTVLASAKAASR
jgi:type II secretory pathway component GspD/PulD (secretin)